MPFGKLLRRVIAGVGVNTSVRKKHAENEKKRFVPLSISPFKENAIETTGGKGEKDNGKDGKKVDEKAQSPWLEISGDLAWTATFSSLTSNTGVSAHAKVSSYAVFFALVWHLWATQISYDIRYYTNDWYHRAAFLVRLSVYAGLAAFSKSFNVFWMIAHTDQYGFTGGADAVTAQAILDNSERTSLRTFKAVNLILMISRLLLLVSYLRALLYRLDPRRQEKFDKRHLLVPASLLLAATSFLLAFILITTVTPSRRVALGQFFLWGLAIVIQITASVLTPKDPEGVLKSEVVVESRLSTLTVIILGEGLNGICSTLSTALAPIGLASSTMGDGVGLAFILYFLWLLYFDGFQVPEPPGLKLETVWILPSGDYHLRLILMLEGIKNAYLFATSLRAVNFFDDTFVDWIAHNGTGADVPLLKEICLSMGQSWDAVVQGWNETAEDTKGQENSTLVVYLQQYRWLVTSYHDIYGMYQDPPDDKAEYLYNNYVSDSNTANFTIDAEDPETPLFQAILDRWTTVTGYSCYWVLGISGATMICLAILNAIHRRPEDRYVWSYVWIRLVSGILLVVLGFTVDYWSQSTFTVPWFIGSIAIVLAVAAILDQLILFISVRDIKRKLATSLGYDEADVPSNTPRPDDTDEQRPPLKSDAKSDLGTVGRSTSFPSPSLPKHPNPASESS